MDYPIAALFYLDRTSDYWVSVTTVQIRHGLHVLGSWSTLLTPIPILLSSPLVGTELDMTSDVFLEYSKSGLFDSCFHSGLSFTFV